MMVGNVDMIPYVFDCCLRGLVVGGSVALTAYGSGVFGVLAYHCYFPQRQEVSFLESLVGDVCTLGGIAILAFGGINTYHLVSELF